MNFDEGICWVSVCSYPGLRVSNQGEFLWRHLVSLSLKFCKFMSFIQKRILMNKFVVSHFEVMQVYEFQKKPNSYEDICSVSVWSYVSLPVSNKREFLWRYLLSLSFKLSKFTNFKRKGILMKTFVESQFELM